MNELEIVYPDDWHCHLRDFSYLDTTVANSAKQFKRAIVMPNCVPPITTVQAAKEYLCRIEQSLPPNSTFQPLLTLYLTDKTTPELIREAKASGIIYACKLYPQGATTNSENGVTSLIKLYPVFEALSQYQLPLLIHGEVTAHEVDIFDRESVFIKQDLIPILKNFPQLKVVLEHITTNDAVDFVSAGPQTLAATITPHHLMLNRNDMLSGGLNPHYYCLPILKRQTHQQALIKAATSGNPKFFIGTDSAPHAKSKKESACGCAGIYHTAALSIYADVFEKVNALDKLEGFASLFGPDFYELPYNKEKLFLHKKAWQVPKECVFAETTVVPFLANKQLSWQCIEGEEKK